MKLKTFFFFVLLTTHFFSQTKEQKEIDSLIKTYRQNYEKYNYKATLSNAKTLLLKSEKYKNEKGLAVGNAFVGYSLSVAGKYKESISYINKSNHYSDFIKRDFDLRQTNQNILAFNYQQLGLYSLALDIYHKSLYALQNKKDKTDTEFSLQKSIEVNLANLHNQMKQHDSAYFYYKKDIANPQLKLNYIKKAYQFNGIGFYYLQKKNSDSAHYYYQKSLNYFKENEIHYHKADAFIGLAQAYSLDNNYTQAIDYSLKAIKIYEDLDLMNGEINTFKSVGDYYNKIGNYKLGKVYTEKYLQKKDSIDLATKEEANYVLSEVINLERIQQKNLHEKNLRITGIIIFILILLLIIVLYFYKAAKNKNDHKTSKVKEILREKENERRRLQQKVNESFGGIVDLAKNNSPEFFTRFQEVYPQVVKKLLEIDPKFRVSELTLCAYVFLGFTTKDIALHTFKSINTVHSRKYNLRKKLNISSEENMELWLKNLS